MLVGKIYETEGERKNSIFWTKPKSKALTHLSKVLMRRARWDLNFAPWSASPQGEQSIRPQLSLVDWHTLAKAHAGLLRGTSRIDVSPNCSSSSQPSPCKSIRNKHLLLEFLLSHLPLFSCYALLHSSFMTWVA